MRVIAGKWKSHGLQAPRGSGTRPTTDRVKESMFNLLPHQFQGTVVDLFAGSGGLGIEALSRGAESAFFVDKDHKAIAVIRENVHRLQAQDQSVVLQMDWRAALTKIGEQMKRIDWIFLDPPYRNSLWEPAMEAALQSFEVTGGILCEHPKDVVLPNTVHGLVQKKHKEYGDIAVSIYGPA